MKNNQIQKHQEKVRKSNIYNIQKNVNFYLMKLNYSATVLLYYLFEYFLSLQICTKKYAQIHVHVFHFDVD